MSVLCIVIHNPKFDWYNPTTNNTSYEIHKHHTNIFVREKNILYTTEQPL